MHFRGGTDRCQLSCKRPSMLPDELSIGAQSDRRWAGMAGSDTESGSPRGSRFRDALEEEPRLKYNSLGAESPRAAASAAAPATRLCVSDKVLAVGHRDGSVQLLDHLGNQVGWARTEGGPTQQGGRSAVANPCRRRRRCRSCLLPIPGPARAVPSSAIRTLCRSRCCGSTRGR